MVMILIKQLLMQIVMYSDKTAYNEIVMILIRQLIMQILMYSDKTAHNANSDDSDKTAYYANSDYLDKTAYNEYYWDPHFLHW